MSTFKGIVAEFPQIRIDYFRKQPGHQAPLACFLSHVHSDHLTGLESLGAPFVYCSAATREILLRLEKYHYRVNFARGILESRYVTYGKSMHKLAKPLPLETPTVIELSPGNEIRVTLFDANHCIGAVMFLIEGGGKAILYTGDIRAETWWVNSLVQNPVLLPYTCGARRLDCVYLDSTFATKSEPYREFPTKADGIRELLEKVDKYPKDTVFYFHSWTFGYENVWIALSSFLNTQVHLDKYRAGIYLSLSSTTNKELKEKGAGHDIREAPALCGFMNGNHPHPGCLTENPNVRLHSCERGMGCPVVDHDTSANIVHIIPIVSRANGTEIAEIGAGGGKGDLDQKEELDTGDVTHVGKLMELCAEKIDDAELLSKVLAMLQRALDNGNDKIDLGQSLQKESQGSGEDMSLQELVSALSHGVERSDEPKNRVIRFPYSRHSSYSELCTLISALNPKDVYPCTVDDSTWNPALGMRNLFGQFCSADVFRHDLEMMEAYESRLRREGKAKRNLDTQGSEDDMNIMATGSSFLGDTAEFFTPLQSPSRMQPVQSPRIGSLDGPASSPPRNGVDTHQMVTPKPTNPGENIPVSSMTSTVTTALSSPPGPTACSPEDSDMRRTSLTNKRIAYNAALGFGLTWADFGGLVSTRRKSAYDEEEL